MLTYLNNICQKLPEHRTKTALILAIIAFSSSFILQYFFTHQLLIDIWLGLGTGFSTFVIVWIFHFLIFSFFKSNKWKYGLVMTFPILYVGALTCIFGAFTTLVSLTWFQVPFINQVYLQIWVFMGQAAIYLAFSPKFSLILVSILVIVSFSHALKTINSQLSDQAKHS